MSNHAFRRAGGGIAVCALALTGFLVASPAVAVGDAESLPFSGSAFDAKATSLLQLDGVVSVTRDKDDNVVVRTEENAPAATVQAVDELETRYDNIVAGTSEPNIAYSVTDVVGGAGYSMSDTADNRYSCSIGFSAWTPSGGPALVTAGHCAEDMKPEVTLTRPSGDDAVGANPFEPVAGLGTFGFSQFGGPDKSVGGETANSVDIGVIDVTNPAVTLQPAVTDWTGGAADNLAASTLPVKSIGNPAIGQTVVKSGRTTGHTTGGTVTEIGWANIGGRTVRGVKAMGLYGQPGDSGGAVLAGTTAVGVVSGGPDGGAWTWVANIADSLSLTGGYTLQLALDAPTLNVASGSDVIRGSRISGTAPAGTTVTVEGDGGFTATVAVAADGAWSFTAPMTVGALTFSATAASGFNQSPALNATLNVIAGPLTAPTITSPAPGGTATSPVTAITGTANPGYTVTLTGDVTGTAVADADGVWSIPANLGVGSYTISAVQSYEGETSEAAAAAFTVTEAPAPEPPAAPVAPAPGTTTAGAEAAGVLANTGANAAPFAAGAVALLLVGGILLIIRRRRTAA